VYFQPTISVFDVRASVVVGVTIAQIFRQMVIAVSL